MTDPVAPVVAAESRYQQLVSDRDHFIERGDKCAKLTLPTLFRRDTSSTNGKIKDPAQTVGATGVNTLAAKMILSLLPVNTPFFKLNIDEMDPELEDPDFAKEVLKGLGKIERQVLRDIENSGDVTALYEGLKHLTVVGNVLAYVGEDGTRMLDLNKYVVVRTPAGVWTEIVVCEEVSPTSLPKNVRAAIEKSGMQDVGKSPDKTLKLYTHVTREDEQVRWHQEICGVVVEGSESNVPDEGNPWIPLRFLRVDGEAYGRSYVEMYLGDLQSLEILTNAVNEASAAAAKVIFLVRPNGTTNAKVIASAPNLAVRAGDAADVTVLRLDKQADLSVAKSMIETIERRLGYAFMLNAQVMRDAERVTAEEVRYVAQELDAALGGIYSLLSREFQLPYVNRRLFMMRKRRGMPKLPPSIQTAIVTGFAALGRGHDGDKLLRFLEKVERAAAVAAALGGKINIDELITRFAIADGIDISGLLIPQEDQAAAQQEGQTQNMIETLGPEVIRQGGPMIQQMMQGGPNGQETPAAG